MRRKEVKPSAFKGIHQNPELLEEHMELPDIESMTYLHFLTREEKIQEASKPLYLKRYE